MKRVGLALLVLAAVLTSFAGAGKVFLNIATGGTAGTYFPLGGAMAEIINNNVADVNATAVTSGASVANINMLATDEVQMAFVQNDIAFYAYNGVEMFKDKQQANVRAVATLYNETIQVVTLASTRVKSLADLKGKRVAVCAAGSGAEVNARQVLEAAGLTYKDISPQYLSFAEAANGLRDGNTDVAFLTAGAPTAAVRDVAAQKDVVIIPVPKNIADKLIAKYPFYVRVKIPKDTYSKQTADVDTVTVKSILVASASLDETVVYNATKAIFTNLDRLIQAHAQGRNITRATALEGLPIPVHPGAERFFKEK
ncbi:MAG: TAXI family TRAP transporter solute-binding subunit [Acidobacteria bacterium]|nr:TAXI family TRAP transporter solute-binding subunit [Acidobacteriota bacterium]